MERFNTYCNACGFRSSILFPLLTCFQGFVCSRGESAVQVTLFAVFSHLVRKLQVHKCSLLFYLRLHLHKGSTTREGTLDGTSGGWATLFILDSMKLKDISEMEYFNQTEEQKEGTLLLPVDCVLPVDVRSGSLINLETPAVMISTPSLSPLTSGIIWL